MELFNSDGTPFTYEQKCEYIRNRRNKFLSMDIDTFNAIRWDSLSQEQKSLWTNYRQDLLNIPQQSGFPEDVVWPIKP
jgi:hypothetical protein